MRNITAPTLRRCDDEVRSILSCSHKLRLCTSSNICRVVVEDKTAVHTNLHLGTICHCNDAVERQWITLAIYLPVRVYNLDIADKSIGNRLGVACNCPALTAIERNLDHHAIVANAHLGSCCIYRHTLAINEDERCVAILIVLRPAEYTLLILENGDKVLWKCCTLWIYRKGATVRECYKDATIRLGLKLGDGNLTCEKLLDGVKLGIEALLQLGKFLLDLLNLLANLCIVVRRAARDSWHCQCCHKSSTARPILNHC